jgi:hypothetical protein
LGYGCGSALQVTTLLSKMKEYKGVPTVSAEQLASLKAELAGQGDVVKEAKTVRQGLRMCGCTDVRMQGSGHGGGSGTGVWGLGRSAKHDGGKVSH